VIVEDDVDFSLRDCVVNFFYCQVLSSNCIVYYKLYFIICFFAAVLHIWVTSICWTTFPLLRMRQKLVYVSVVWSACCSHVDLRLNAWKTNCYKFFTASELPLFCVVSKLTAFPSIVTLWHSGTVNLILVGLHIC